MKDLPVSIYWMPEWWDARFHQATGQPRPTEPAQEALETMFTARQRFLFEQFGQFGIGEESPALHGQIATVIRYGFDLVPVLFGTKLDFDDAWGFYPTFRTLDDVRDLAPVDVRTHAVGEWIAAEKARLEARYGAATHCIDIGSVTNNAFRILGQDLYLALASEPAAITRLFEVILETETLLYAFLRELFPPLDPVPISNCNVHLMGPRLYEDLVLPFDSRQNRFAEQLAKVPARCALHHCDVRTDDYLGAFQRLPGLVSLQASFESDIATAKRVLPGCAFSALVSPPRMTGPLPDLAARLEHAVAAGADDLAVWNIDSSISVAKFRQILGAIRDAAGRHGARATFSAMPLCWEEIEWAHGQYQGVVVS